MSQKTDKESDKVRRSLDKCQVELWSLNEELRGLGELLQAAAVTDQNKMLSGVGLILKRHSEQLSTINSLISSIY